MKNHILLISFAIFHASQNSVHSSFLLATQLLFNLSLNPSGKSHENIQEKLFSDHNITNGFTSLSVESACLIF